MKDLYFGLQKKLNWLANNAGYLPTFGKQLQQIYRKYANSSSRGHDFSRCIFLH
jgi:hypothetical protein